MVSPFFDLKPVNGGIKNEEGKYVVTISVPSLTKAMTDVQILHYSTVRNLFELITPTSVDYEGKTITAVFEDLSPVAIIAKLMLLKLLILQSEHPRRQVYRLHGWYSSE